MTVVAAIRDCLYDRAHRGFAVFELRRDLAHKRQPQECEIAVVAQLLQRLQHAAKICCMPLGRGNDHQPTISIFVVEAKIRAKAYAIYTAADGVLIVKGLLSGKFRGVTLLGKDVDPNCTQDRAGKTFQLLHRFCCRIVSYAGGDESGYRYGFCVLFIEPDHVGLVQDRMAGSIGDRKAQSRRMCAHR